MFEFKDFWIDPWITTLNTMTLPENYNLTYNETVELLYNTQQISEELYQDFKKNNCKTFACLYAIPYKEQSDSESNNDINCPFEKRRGPLGICCFCPTSTNNITTDGCLDGILEEIDKYSNLLKSDLLRQTTTLRYKQHRIDLIQILQRLEYSKFYINDQTASKEGY